MQQLLDSGMRNRLAVAIRHAFSNADSRVHPKKVVGHAASREDLRSQKS